MTIRVTCECGKILGSHDSDAGLKGVCPYCGRTLQVPGEPPIQESFPEVHGGPISDRSVKRVESWLFAQQTRLWVLMILLIPGLGLLVLWHSARQQKRNAQNEAAVIGPIQAIQRAHRESKLKKLPKRDSTAAVPYDLTKRPEEYSWSSNFQAFAGAVQASLERQSDVDSRFATHEVRWTVTFERLEEDNLFFREAEAMLARYPAINVWAEILPFERKRALQLTSGDRVTIRGVLGTALFIKTESHPLGITRIGPRKCILE